MTLATNRRFPVPLSPSQVRTLKRRAADNSLEVEHLITLARRGDASAAPLLRQLKQEHRWSVTGFENGRRVVPFGRWADVICCYLEQGYDGLVALATGPKAKRSLADFCIGLIEVLPDPASVRALVEIGGPVLRSPAKDLTLAARLARGFHMLLSYEESRNLPGGPAAAVREFLHRLLALEVKDIDRANCLYALWEVGDETSFAVISALAELKNPWEKLRAKTVSTITTRLK
jgi:hypothetical protein